MRTRSGEALCIAVMHKHVAANACSPPLLINDQLSVAAIVMECVPVNFVLVGITAQERVDAAACVGLHLLAAQGLGLRLKTVSSCMRSSAVAARKAELRVGRLAGAPRRSASGCAARTWRPTTSRSPPPPCWRRPRPAARPPRATTPTRRPRQRSASWQGLRDHAVSQVMCPHAHVFGFICPGHALGWYAVPE